MNDGLQPLADRPSARIDTDCADCTDCIDLLGRPLAICGGLAKSHRNLHTQRRGRFKNACRPKATPGRANEAGKRIEHVVSSSTEEPPGWHRDAVNRLSAPALSVIGSFATSANSRRHADVATASS
ncbi:MAG: hypothetical protein D6741_07860 [Planctomycetota bacterium]|nr:MAG: hypothetical protein D6741_07860 [Planctomycetota bacterium]